MTIDWAALGTVFGVSLALTVGLVGLFTLGIVALSKRGPAGEREGSAALTTSGAYVCFALCAAAVAYGIYVIVA
ncbi:hypothetical protein [Streptomyces beihaiensis]|uniref:Secreted protein n=1 Tax=Streptomyces beihaiensis TaxID=2984495 RepID=A0ABT3U7I0_9ACTN|nr:hypothetical protein [Streptomyces beihaiensis]MCX3064138.1 hypothetical protein [Streptomyces beihaiensis]